jgi:type IV pilus assembly protein PilN
VILINLLPHREAARKRRQEFFYATLVAAALFGALVAGLVYVWYETQISNQRSKNQYLQTEIKRLEAQIKDVATLQAEIASLRARQQAVEDLQSDRNLPVHLLNEITRQLPDGVYLSSLRQQNQSVTIIGTAQSNERVSELLRNFANNSPWLARPELVEIVAGNLALSPRDQRRVANFTMRVQLRRPSEVKSAVAVPASAASSPASSASAPASAAPSSAGSASAPAGAVSAPASSASVARPPVRAGSAAVLKP